jgi:hypothetical protein
MRNCYENIPSNQIEKQKRYFYGAIINLMYLREDNSPFLDATIQTLINQIGGSNRLFGFQPEVLTIVSNLETARRDSSQFRKCVLDAANLVDKLNGGDSDVNV